MKNVVNGTPVGQLPPLVWRKSVRSGPSGNCVELAVLPDGASVAVRNSRDPQGVALIYTTSEIRAFIRDARAGEFDEFLA